VVIPQDQIDSLFIVNIGVRNVSRKDKVEPVTITLALYRAKILETAPSSDDLSRTYVLRLRDIIANFDKLTLTRGAMEYMGPSLEGLV
jgi:hypothetical protein